MALSDRQTTAATDIALTNVRAQQDRLDNTRKLEYSEGVWTKSQSMDSKLSSSVKHDSISECFKWYSRTDRRDFVAKAAGIVATPYKGHGFDRRGLLTKPYHDAYLVDRDDLLVTSVDPFATVKQQLQYALGRLTDQVILQSITDKVIIEKPPTNEDFDGTDATRTDAKRHYTGQGMSLHVKQITFLPSRLMTGNDTAKAALFASKASTNMDDLEEVFNVFRKRDKMDTMLFCTYTPELQLRMRTNPEWKNAENVYHGASDMGKSGATFVYKGISFVPINEDALPIVASGDGISTAVASGNATIRCRSMRGTSLRGTTAESHPAKSATNREVNSVAKQDLIYFWEKEAVILAKQGSPEIGQVFDEVRLSMAKGMYSHVRLGGMLMDEDCVLVTPLNGQRVA